MQSHLTHTGTATTAAGGVPLLSLVLVSRTEQLGSSEGRLLLLLCGVFCGAWEVALGAALSSWHTLGYLRQFRITRTGTTGGVPLNTWPDSDKAAGVFRGAFPAVTLGCHVGGGRCH
jgi:hypothetical protein